MLFPVKTNGWKNTFLFNMTVQISRYFHRWLRILPLSPHVPVLIMMINKLPARGKRWHFSRTVHFTVKSRREEDWCCKASISISLRPLLKCCMSYDTPCVIFDPLYWEFLFFLFWRICSICSGKQLFTYLCLLPSSESQRQHERSNYIDQWLSL